jgi:hypothetical protein
MVYNTQNYQVFGLCSSSCITETRKHNVSETGSIAIVRWGGETPTLLGPNTVGVSILTCGQKKINFKKHCVFQFLEYKTMDKVQNPSNFKRRRIELPYVSCKKQTRNILHLMLTYKVSWQIMKYGLSQIGNVYLFLTNLNFCSAWPDRSKLL